MVILSWWTVKRKGLSNHNSCLRRDYWFFDPVWFCSLDLRRGPNYNSIGETGTSPKCKAPVVFCIHGNKYGVVKCCDNLDEAGASARNEDNAKLTGTLNEVSDEDASSSRRNRRAPSGMSALTQRTFHHQRGFCHFENAVAEKIGEIFCCHKNLRYQ